jgi:hypothetical protein
MELLDARISSLQRRSNSLSQEINHWIDYADQGQPLEKNLSQLQALDVFMSQIVNRLQKDSSTLTSIFQATPANTEAVLSQAQIVENGLVKADAIWSYFRSKLEQRFVPQFADSLFAVDLISHDCYTTTMNRANSLGIKHRLGLRDYPLTYLLAEYSPVTWTRSLQIPELFPRMLPVPVIGVPWNHIANPWELLSLHHEVSHDIDADLNSPSLELGLILKQTLIEKGLSYENANSWQGWIGEIFADFSGTLLAGPSFVSFLAGFLTLPSGSVSFFSPDDPHPISYVRTLLNCTFVHTISASPSMHNYIDRLSAQWKEVYGEPAQAIASFIDDFEVVVEVILSTKLAAFKDERGKLHALSELIEFNDDDFSKQLAASQHFLSGINPPGNVPIRHLIGAAYMAMEEHIVVNKRLDGDFATRLSDLLSNSIKEKAPRGQLALRTRRSTTYLQELADAYYNSHLQYLGGSNDQTIQ